MSDPQIDVEVDSGIQEISIDFDTAISDITLNAIVPSIDIVEVSTAFSAVRSVNSLNGDVVLTYIQTLSYVSPVSGIYSYTINHNLGHESPVVMVYNTDNESVIADHDIIDANTLEIRSLSNMNNFKVVVQR